MGRSFPKTGANWDELKTRLTEGRQGDVDWRTGKISGLLYYAGEDVIKVAHDAYAMYFNENAVYPKVFPSLARMEEEVIDLSLALLNGGERASGSMTTGGTESIFLAIKTARDWARANKPANGTPEILMSRTAHPAFDRAAELMDLKVVRLDPGPDFRADVDAMSNAITDNTIMMVGSAPEYPHGIVDPITDLGKLAQSRERMASRRLLHRRVHGAHLSGSWATPSPTSISRCRESGPYPRTYTRTATPPRALQPSSTATPNT